MQDKVGIGRAVMLSSVFGGEPLEVLKLGEILERKRAVATEEKTAMEVFEAMLECKELPKKACAETRGGVRENGELMTGAVQWLNMELTVAEFEQVLTVVLESLMHEARQAVWEKENPGHCLAEVMEMPKELKMVLGGAVAELRLRAVKLQEARECLQEAHVRAGGLRETIEIKACDKMLEQVMFAKEACSKRVLLKMDVVQGKDSARGSKDEQCQKEKEKMLELEDLKEVTPR